MPKARFTRARITAMHTVLGSRLRRFEDDLEAFGGDVARLQRLQKALGLRERRQAADGVTTADLCKRAVDRLSLQGEADALICVTQTPDHWQPCNAALLHGRLDWSEDCAAFDVNLGCSGWVYALYLAYSLIEAGGCRRVVVAAGDTMSRCIHPRDRSTACLFGDAGSATLVEASGSGEEPAWFALHTRGKGAAHICIPAGGFRQPADASTRRETTDDEGNIRSAENLFMDGSEVFNFAVRDEPKAIREILDFAGVDIGGIDIFGFHQANRFVLGSIATRLKIPPEKVPMESVGRFGNLSSASIPGVLCDERSDDLCAEPQTLLLSGFGVGFSWASFVQKTAPWTHCGLSVY